MKVRLATPAVAALLIGVSAVGLPSTAAAHDYPTIERVEFVHMCQRESPDKPPHEMLYKCSCVIDKLAVDLTHEEFVEGSTAYYASSIAGERGQVIRNERVAKALADNFRERLGKARKSCFITN